MSCSVAIAVGVLVLSAADLALGQWPPPTSDPEPLNTNAATDSGGDVHPKVATDGQGNWVAVWGSTDTLDGTIDTDTDILYSRSTDNGVTWTDPVALNTNAASDSLDDWFPTDLMTDGQTTWLVLWEYEHEQEDDDILFSRSMDKGTTWSEPLLLNSNADYDNGQDHEADLATDGQGNWVAVWQSEDDLGGTIEFDRDILFSRSTDSGLTWSTLLPLNTNAETDSGNDHFPEVATDGLGNWVAVWSSNENIAGTIGTDGDILFSRSTDNGQTWTDPGPLNTNAASDSGFDLVPQVTANGDGTWVVVWSSSDDLDGTIDTDWDILASHSTDGGVSWTAPVALNGNAGSDSGDDWVYQITTDGRDNWVTVWFSNDGLGGTAGADDDILVSRSTDGGATWTPPILLNTNAGTDTGQDQFPDITTDAQGNWVVVWDSDEQDIGEGIGSDKDILFTHFQLYPPGIPTVSKWGALTMTLLVLTAGTVVLRRRRRVACN
ncbi:MAG: exo-alpha-sialidase [Phycisphaerales bacterium]|nr:MAG: exo-alpha-sialidase [Phycisphaerales bacterium]